MLSQYILKYEGYSDLKMQYSNHDNADVFKSIRVVLDMEVMCCEGKVVGKIEDFLINEEVEILSILIEDRADRKRFVKLPLTMLKPLNFTKNIVQISLTKHQFDELSTLEI